MTTSTKKITRYEPRHRFRTWAENGYTGIIMVSHRHGRYVSHKRYAELKQQLARAHEAMAWLDGHVSHLNDLADSQWARASGQQRIMNAQAATAIHIRDTLRNAINS